MAIKKKDLFAAFEVCDCDAFFFAETWPSGKKICLLRLKCVILMRFSLLKCGDQKGNNVVMSTRGPLLLSWFFPARSRQFDTCPNVATMTD